MDSSFHAWKLFRCSLAATIRFPKFCSRTFPAALNAFVFRHVIKDHTATECVDVVIRFAHRHAIKDYADCSFRKTGWATFGGHGEKINRGTDTSLRANRTKSFYTIFTLNLFFASNPSSRKRPKFPVRNLFESKLLPTKLRSKALQTVCTNLESVYY